MNPIKLVLILFVVTPNFCFSQLNSDTPLAQKFDMGKMWTFENPPLDYFEQEYDFKPTTEWLEFVRKSALRFGNGCSASFISEDGLIMTNHHCVRGLLPGIQTGEENILRDGFFAKSLNEERPVKGLFVDQLVIIQDVTKEIHSAMDNGATDNEKVKLRKDKIKEIEHRYTKKDVSLVYKVVALYNGGKYSLYGYKRFNDIRMVFAPDLRTAKFGGDYDNFTFPRYGLDCAFLRAYENDKPVKTKYFFKWSSDGAVENELVFVIGNPGSTERLSTVAQMEYARDIRFPSRVNMLRELYDLRYKEVMESNAEDYEKIARLYSVGNTLKVYEGTWNALKDNYIFARKRAFEKEFRSAIEKDAELNNLYGSLWDEIENSRKEAASYAKEMYAYTLSGQYTSSYFFIANDIVNAVKNNPGNLNVDSVVNEIYPEDINIEYEKELLKIHTRLLVDNLGNSNDLIKQLLNGKRGYDAADYLLSTTKLKDKDSIAAFLKLSSSELFKSQDPFIYFIVNTQDKLAELRKRNEEIENKETINNQLLGEALFRIYGDAIPPDATFSLRIADGRLQSYSYNGTIAPVYTTFHGVLDRYNGFGKVFPYNLPPVWENLPGEFELDTKLNFISTNDITGGNSGSPVINRNAEIVGLAFDGNIESLSGDYIFTTEANRTVSVHSSGMVEAIRDLYNAERISNEILNGKIK